MTQAEIINALAVPTKKVDVVLDTDTYNEIDDQFAVAYLLRSDEKLNCKALYAAPFFNNRSTGPKDGMEKSFDELKKILTLCGREDMIQYSFKGSESFLADEKTPVISDAAQDLVKRANNYDKENPLFVVAIGAITNIASALLLDASIAEKIVIVWLGGHARHWHDTKEFNMFQDIAAARVVFSSGAPIVQLPCCGVVSEFVVSQPDLEKWLVGANPLCNYLAQNTIDYCGGDSHIWHKVIWDVTAVAWLLNDNCKFMLEQIVHIAMPQYDYSYSYSDNTPFMKYVYHINTDALLTDLFNKLRK